MLDALKLDFFTEQIYQSQTDDYTLFYVNYTII